MDFESARRLAVARLNQIHPSGSLPEWVDRAITIGGARSAGGEWKVDFFLFEKEPLEAGERWGLINDSRVLIRLNPATGNEMVVLPAVVRLSPWWCSVCWWIQAQLRSAFCVIPSSPN